jgi:HPr Serine kinase C-terminal domain
VHLYCISGLSVRSEIALPGLNAAVADRGDPDVTIRRRPVPAALENARAISPTLQMAGKQFLFHIPNVARFLLSDGREIAFEVEPDCDDGDIPIFLIGTVFGILLHQREHIVLHASAVRVNGKAVLFCGQSGEGKSTLAAALTQRGYPLITDDLCVITVTGTGAPMAHPDGRQLKLWAQTIEELDLKENRGVRVRGCLEKFYVKPGEAYTDTLPLGTVYVLREAQPPHMPGIERPNVVDAARVFWRNAYHPMLVSRMGQKAHYFQASTTVADKAGIFLLTRALDFSAMPEVVSWLERHWWDIGLMEKVA